MTEDAAQQRIHEPAPECDPVLSVVMPAYNAEPHIGGAIESILTQTVRNLELIIVDDQSTDATWAVMQEYAKKDSRIRISRSDKNSGPGATTNLAVTMARSPLIARMDADDIALPTRMEKQVALISQRPDISALGCYVSHTNMDNQVLSLSRIGPTSGAEFERLRQEGKPTLLLGGTIMFRRDLFDLVGGFDGTLRTAADLEFCDRMADHGAIIAIPEPLQLYRVYPTSNVMMHYWEGRKTHRYVEFRRNAMNRGEPVPTRAEYVENERRASLWRRLRLFQVDASHYYYRRGGIAYAEGRVLRTALMLAVAAAARPAYVIRRMWDQRLSPQARVTRGI